MTKHAWSKKKLAVAEAMAEGTRTQGAIAKEFNIKEAQISRWKREPEFMQKIDEITMSLERHTLAGMLRRIDSQQKKTAVRDDEWLKLEEFRAKLLGHDKQKIEHGDQKIIIDIRRNDKNNETNVDTDRPAITDT